jgi:diaminohydroxyphosphoribosylaminopyrimidine deaminase/5-amino-6-(5-phosphoribosylamino)uracil reductase
MKWMALDTERLMRLAMAEAERARGKTGDNPWVGCVIVTEAGEVLGQGHTQGPGEDHAEISASRAALQRVPSLAGLTLFSTLEPCSFHGRTPACARRILEHGITRVFIGMRDPHPRVDGVSVQMLREAGIDVIEGVCEAEVRRQLGDWVLRQHPHDIRRRADALAREGHSTDVIIAALAELYGLDTAILEPLFDVAGA